MSYDPVATTITIEKEIDGISFHGAVTRARNPRGGPWRPLEE